MNIQTTRLSLRPLASGDASTLFAIMSDEEAMRFWDWPPVAALESAQDIVSSQIADMEEGSALYWAVDLRANESAIGVCDLSAVDRYHGRAEVGFLFDRAHWGQGYALEAMGAVVQHARTSLNLVRLWARMHAGNDASRRLLERLGFSFEGRLRGHVVREGIRRDCLIYGLALDRF